MQFESTSLKGRMMQRIARVEEQDDVGASESSS